MKMLGTMDEKLKNHLIFRLCPLSALLEALYLPVAPFRELTEGSSSFFPKQLLSGQEDKKLWRAYAHQFWC